MDEISLITVEFLLDYIIRTVILKEFTMINVIKVCAKWNNYCSPLIGKVSTYSVVRWNISFLPYRSNNICN